MKSPKKITKNTQKSRKKGGAYELKHQLTPTQHIKKLSSKASENIHMLKRDLCKTLRGESSSTKLASQRQLLMLMLGGDMNLNYFVTKNGELLPGNDICDQLALFVKPYRLRKSRYKTTLIKTLKTLEKYLIRFESLRRLIKIVFYFAIAGAPLYASLTGAVGVTFMGTTLFQNYIAGAALSVGITQKFYKNMITDFFLMISSWKHANDLCTAMDEGITEKLRINMDTIAIELAEMEVNVNAMSMEELTELLENKDDDLLNSKEATTLKSIASQGSVQEVRRTLLEQLPQKCHAYHFFDHFGKPRTTGEQIAKVYVISRMMIREEMLKMPTVWYGSSEHTTSDTRNSGWWQRWRGGTTK